MLNLYVPALVICTALSLVLMVPGIALIVGIGTMGIGFLLYPLLLLATLLLWALLPAALFWHSGGRWLLVALGLIVTALLLALPIVLADRAAARLVDEGGSLQPAALALTDPVGVEIIRHRSHHPDLYGANALQSAFYFHAPCFDLCERLLLGGKVAWVRIVLRDDAFVNSGARTQAFFVAAPGPACNAVNADLPPASPCVLFAPDHRLPADLTLDLEDRRIWPKERRNDWPLQEIGMRMATAYLGPDRSKVVFRATQVFHDRPIGLIGLKSGNLSSVAKVGGPTLMRRRSATAPIDLAEAVAAMGFPLAPSREAVPKAKGTEDNPFIQPPPDAQDAAYVVSMLATGPETGETFSNSFGQVLNDWHKDLRWKPDLTAADRAIFCASLGDPRIRNYFWDDQVVRKHRLACR